MFRMIFRIFMVQWFRELNMIFINLTFDILVMSGILVKLLSEVRFVPNWLKVKTQMQETVI